MTRFTGKLTHPSMSENDCATAAGTILPSPRNVADTGLPRQLLVELLAKNLYGAGTCSLDALVQSLRLPAPVLLEVLAFMTGERLLQLARRGAGPSDIDYQLTELGRERAAAFLLHCRYTGPAPVTLSAYRTMVQRQSVRRNRVTRDDIDAAFADVVLSAALREQIGSAMNAGRSLFLSGPPGSGKSTLARKLAGLMQGHVYIPYALVVDNEIIVVHDPLLHHTVAAPVQQTSFLRDAGGDARWLYCQRPFVHAGGELTLDMLGLRYDGSAGYYQAPPQLKANNGIFIVDDLGCQRAPARDLINRWLLPLDRGCDHLCLHTGYQFAAPFDVALVFASSAAPDPVADAAFMRRMSYKVHLGALSENQYRTLTRHQCAELDIAYDEAAFRFLVGQLHRTSGRPRLAVYPRELLLLIVEQARYLHQAPLMTAQTVEHAWHAYFATAPGHEHEDNEDGAVGEAAELLHIVGREGLA